MLFPLVLCSIAFLHSLLVAVVSLILIFQPLGQGAARRQMISAEAPASATIASLAMWAVVDVYGKSTE